MADAKKKLRLVRGSSRKGNNIGMSQPNDEAATAYKMLGPTRMVASEYVSPNIGQISGYQTWKFIVGDAVYRAMIWNVKCDAEIVGKTEEIAGIHYLKRDVMHEYLEHVRLLSGGSQLQEWSVSEMVTLNKYHNIDFGPVHTGLAFPGEFMFTSELMTDVFGLGTKGMRDLYLHIKPVKNVFDPATMEIVVMPHVVDRVKPVGFTFKNERFTETFAGVGRHTYSDLPIDDDIRFVWIKGDGIQSLLVKVDKEILYDVDRAQYEAYLIEKRRNVTALNGGWLIDLFAERNPRALGALDKRVERKRDARLRIELVATEAQTPVEFIVMNSDLYRQLR